MTTSRPALPSAPRLSACVRMPRGCSQPTLREPPQAQLAPCSRVSLLFLRIQLLWNIVSRSTLSRCLAGCQPLVGGERQELGEIACERHFREDLGRGLVPGAEFLQLLALELEHPLA